MPDKIDVLFIWTNINAFHPDAYNFGIGYLSSILNERGFNSALEIVHRSSDYKKVMKKIMNYKPKVIGFSAVSSQFVFISDLAREIKKTYKGIIVCGGVHTTIFPESLFDAPDLDGVFIGESDYSFADFVSAVIKGDDYHGIDNFCYVQDGKLNKNKLRAKVADLSTLPFPDRAIYNYQSIIDENGGTATIMTSRGCPFLCAYCVNKAIAHVYGDKINTPRYNSVDKSLAEVGAIISKYKVRNIWFADDLFIANKQWLEDFLNKYKNAYHVPFMCQARPGICTRDTLVKLKEAGCYKIFLAVEAANDYIRNVVMNRKITKEQMINTFAWANEIGLETLAANIIGVPGETEETIRETIEFNSKVRPTIPAVSIFNPYEGTVLGDYCKEHGLIRKSNPRNFHDRKQSRVKLPTISNSRLMKLSYKFQYLVFKNIDPAKAREALWAYRYRRLEIIFMIGPIFKWFRTSRVTYAIRKKIKDVLVNR